MQINHPSALKAGHPTAALSAVASCAPLGPAWPWRPTYWCHRV